MASIAPIPPARGRSGTKKSSANLDTHLAQANRFERIPFAIFGADIAARSQGANLDREKINIAWRQALSLWSAVAPITFDVPITPEEPLLRIRFVRNQQPNLELATTSGHISRTPSGKALGGASIEIDCDNDLFVDRFVEPTRFPGHIGPFDLVWILGHEIGHALGLDHPAVDPITGSETESAVMSSSGGSVVGRHLFPYDVREVQRLHGTIRLGNPVQANLSANAQLIDASPGVVLQNAGSALIIFGPMGTRAFLDVLIPAKNKFANALRLKFTTVTANVFLNRVEAWDGIVPIQQFSASSRSLGNEGSAGRMHILQLGFLHRPKLINNVLARLEIVFSKQGGNAQVEFGVLQLHEIAIQTLPQPLENQL